MFWSYIIQPTAFISLILAKYNILNMILELKKIAIKRENWKKKKAGLEVLN